MHDTAASEPSRGPTHAEPEPDHGTQTTADDRPSPEFIHRGPLEDQKQHEGIGTRVLRSVDRTVWNAGEKLADTVRSTSESGSFLVHEGAADVKTFVKATVNTAKEALMDRRRLHGAQEALSAGKAAYVNATRTPDHEHPLAEEVKQKLHKIGMHRADAPRADEPVQQKVKDPEFPEGEESQSSSGEKNSQGIVKP